MPIAALEPVWVGPLLPRLHDELMRLLRGLAPADWSRPTRAGAWRVKDVAAHLLDTDARRLSFHRDRAPLPEPAVPLRSHEDLVAFLNGLNAQWVGALQRVGPALLVELLGVAGEQAARFLAGLEPQARAFLPVAWAGESESANWLDVGREYTERWHHQQQIREAVAAPLLTQPDWLRPVIEISLRALPQAYRGAAAPEGCCVQLCISGASGGSWCLRREAEGWSLWRGEAEPWAARVTIGEDDAWRLLLKAVAPGDVEARLGVEGDRRLAAPLLGARALMV